MYKISEFSKLIGISTSKIRYYDKHNLLRPNIKRDDNNNRIFDDDDVIWVNDLLCFQSTGMDLKTLKTVVDANISQDYDTLVDIFEKQEKLINDKINQLQENKKRIDFKLNLYTNKRNGK